MKTLITILFATIWLAYVPMFVANAQETQSDDVFEDEQAPEMPDAPDEFAMDEGSDAPPAPAPAPATTAEAAPAPAADDEVAPAPKAEAKRETKPKARKQAKQDKPAAKTAKADKKKERKTASSSGFRSLKGDCAMHADASESSAVLTTLKGPKKIWTEKHSNGWVKGFRKNGEGYLSSSCFE